MDTGLQQDETVVEIAGFRVVVDDTLPPDVMTVTGHKTDDAGRLSAAVRKAQQREREKAAGVDVIELKFSPYERAEIDEGRVGRGSQGKSYTTTEYIKTLIRRDVERLRHEQGKLAGRICKNCQKSLPRGCGGTWGKEGRCLLARSEIALEL